MITDNKFDFYNITEIADKKYKILDRGIKTYHSIKSFHDISIGPFFNNRFRKIQIETTDYNRRLFPIRFTNYKTRQRLAISSDDTSNKKY